MNMFRQTAGKYVGIAVLALLVVVSFFLGVSSERLKTEKLKEAARQKEDRLPDLRYLHSTNAYAVRRESLLGEMQAHSFSSTVRLSALETNVDNFLSQVRSSETSNFVTRRKFPPSQLFFQAKTNIENSRLFPIFRRMPKGGLLHIHESSSGRAEFVITNIARRPDCFVGWNTNGSGPNRGQLKFTPAPPGNDGGLNGYFPFQVLEARLRGQGVDLASELHHHYMLDHTDPHDENIWNAFGAWWSLLPDLMSYRPVLRDYLRDAFRTLHEDGISHVEIRVVTPVATMFDYTARGLLNTNYTERDTLQEYLDAKDFIRARFNTNFTIRLITTGLRGSATSDAPTVIRKTREYRDYFTNETDETLIVGCDFVGDEDGGRPTVAEVPFLRSIAERPDARIKFYFHDGESAWPGDENLVDAMLLNTKRVGHGFNLFQYPLLEAMMRTNDIALEICPISNQLLRLLHDLRIHPALGYMNRGVQCVLGSDDPSILGNSGLSYDFWEAYYAWGLDLDELKQLAANSLRYSALGPDEKTAALARWNQQWDDWVQWVTTQQP
jgi:adenosine deaminase CECR1